MQDERHFFASDGILMDPETSERTLSAILSGQGPQMTGEALFQATRTALLAIHSSNISSPARCLAIVRRALGDSTPELTVAGASLEASIHLRAGNLEPAIQLAQDGRAQASEYGLEKYVSQFANTIGSAYRRLVNYGEAERWYLEALVSARRASDRTREAGVLVAEMTIAPSVVVSGA